VTDVVYTTGLRNGGHFRGQTAERSLSPASCFETQPCKSIDLHGCSSGWGRSERRRCTRRL